MNREKNERIKWKEKKGETENLPNSDAETKEIAGGACAVQGGCPSSICIIFYQPNAIQTALAGLVEYASSKPPKRVCLERSTGAAVQVARPPEYPTKES